MADQRRFGTSTRRKSDWAGSADQGYTVISAGASVLQQSAVAVEGQTIVRVRGLLSLKPPSVTADQNLIGAVGFAVVSEQAAVAGAASIPGPYSDSDWDGWFLHEFWSFRLEFVDGTGILLSNLNIPIDSKAMRKVHSGDRIVIMAESQAGAVDVSVQFRMLFKLP